MFYSLNHNIDLRTSKNERTHFFIKYLSFHSLKGPQLVVGLRNRWRDIYSERGLLLISSSRSQVIPTFAPPSNLVRDDFWLAACLSFDCDSLHFVKIWPRGSHHVISFRLHTCCTRVPWSMLQFTNHNGTAWQSTRGDQEWIEHPCHMLDNTNTKTVEIWKQYGNKNNGPGI